MPEWKEIATPSRKADYRYKHLRLLAAPPAQHIIGIPSDQQKLPVRIGDVVRIYMRRSWQEANVYLNEINISSWPHERVLEVEWPCPHCAHAHHFVIPESWIAEGKAVFVEKVEKIEA